MLFLGFEVGGRGALQFGRSTRVRFFNCVFLLWRQLLCEFGTARYTAFGVDACKVFVTNPQKYVCCNFAFAGLFACSLRGAQVVMRSIALT